MTKTLAVLFGVVFLLIGVLGFVPGITTDHMLLGIFHVNPAHNVVHPSTVRWALTTALAINHG